MVTLYRIISSKRVHIHFSRDRNFSSSCIVFALLPCIECKWSILFMLSVHWKGVVVRVDETKPELHQIFDTSDKFLIVESVMGKVHYVCKSTIEVVVSIGKDLTSEIHRWQKRMLYVVIGPVKAVSCCPPPLEIDFSPDTKCLDNNCLCHRNPCSHILFVIY